MKVWYTMSMKLKNRFNKVIILINFIFFSSTSNNFAKESFFLNGKKAAKSKIPKTGKWCLDAVPQLTVACEYTSSIVITIIKKILKIILFLGFFKKLSNIKNHKKILKVFSQKRTKSGIFVILKIDGCAR